MPLKLISRAKLFELVWDSPRQYTLLQVRACISIGSWYLLWIPRPGAATPWGSNVFATTRGCKLGQNAPPTLHRSSAHRVRTIGKASPNSSSAASSPGRMT
jgi:hypothetical protein